ncbi:F420-0:Gamma-glutamyl ligase [Leptolyngbya sp. FACHB-321]|uniref:F420-0:Gamma-glutamyl ligase n=1 Tax=Leptolyngbya sp. FACHB-321 TaxID=2692807 RepID=UPI0016870741|nr:F420-0:Gamma-glutamyl ligase [Leptolyngbya sp. FACHB-321]
MIASIAIAVVSVVILLLLALEVQYRRRPGNKLELTAGNWQLEVYEPQRYLLVGELEFRNLTQRLEVMVPEIWVEVKLLSTDSLKGITTDAQVIPRYKDAEPRADGYWEGHIVKREVSPIEIQVEIQGADLSALRVAWIRVHFFTYGPQGRIPRVRHVIVPLVFPSPADSKNWRPATNADVLPIRTHLLTHLDNPVEVVQRYVLPNAQPGDIVTIGETPLAVMQGRFRHPSDLKPGWVARRLCYLFLPTSSLATACGLQTLIDLVGPVRVLFAFGVGAIAKVFGKPGVFYQLAGEQARLIDDVTGTIPPYDQFIVLGPQNPQQVVDQIKRETGLAAAIVDVNDLRAVKVLAASPELTTSFLQQALIKNPAGNASEQTPVVLIRPVKSTKSVT